LFGPLEDLKVPRVRRTSIELSEAILALYASGASTRDISRFLEPVYLALGIRPDGRREILGFWLFGAEGESATNWRQVVREIFPSSKWQLCVR